MTRVSQVRTSAATKLVLNRDNLLEYLRFKGIDISPHSKLNLILTVGGGDVVFDMGILTVVILEDDFDEVEQRMEQAATILSMCNR